MGKMSIVPTKSEPLTEQSIQQRLNHFFASWKYNVDGLYVFEWESDKLIWMKSGYIYEFEIKISRADFKNDFKHKKEKHIILNGPTDEEQLMPRFYESFERNKHLYADIEGCKARLKPTDSYYIANHKKPNYFYYAVPEGMIHPEEVPPYAGLIWILKEYRYVQQSFIIVKQAPQLHKVKYKDAELNLGEKFYYNWQSDRRLRKEAQKDADYVRQQLKQELESKGQKTTYAAMEQNLNFYKEQSESYMKKYFEICRDQNVDRMIIRKMRHKLKEVCPDFDYDALEHECEKIYGINSLSGL